MRLARLRWIPSLALPVAVWALLGWLHAYPEVADVMVLRSARFVAGPTAQPPQQTATGEPRALPDDWRRSPRGLREGWYALPFALARPTEGDWAVYLPAVSMNAAGALDGEPVGDGGRGGDPVRRNWTRPLLWTLAGQRLAAGPHRLAIRVQADRPDGGLLGPVYVGPAATLGRLHARRHALEIEAVWIITLCLVIAGVFTAALFARWRDPVYGWFAASALAWAAMHLDLLLVTPPVAARPWRALWYAAVLAWLVASTRFYAAFVGVRRDGAGALPPTLALVVVACALHDALVRAGAAGPTYDFFLPYAAPPVVLGMTWALVRRFVGALQESADLVADLERRVDAKRAELAESYARLRAVERDRVLAEERERIMREMHDGLGSHLVSTLALLDADPPDRVAVGAAVRGALDDLRLMVDALVPLDGDLLGALALLRARLQPRLEAAGVRVHWQVAALPAIPDLGAATVLEVLRVLQEAVTNVLRHAGARTLTVRTTMVAGERHAARGVVVEIADDGRGFDATTTPGRGLLHMRQRARAIGADLDIDGTPAGTCVRLRMPHVLRTGAAA